MGEIALSFGFSVPGKPSQKVIVGAFWELGIWGSLPRAMNWFRRSLKNVPRSCTRSNMLCVSWLLDPNMPEVPLIISRDKSSIRDTIGPTPSATRGEANEGEALPEEVKGRLKLQLPWRRGRGWRRSHPFRSVRRREKDQSRLSPDARSRGGKYQFYFWLACIFLCSYS